MARQAAHLADLPAFHNEAAAKEYALACSRTLIAC